MSSLKHYAACCRGNDNGRMQNYDLVQDGEVQDGDEPATGKLHWACFAPDSMSGSWSCRTSQGHTWLELPLMRAQSMTYPTRA